jgi:hypothetical protein
MGGVSPGEKRGKIKIYIFDLFFYFFGRKKGLILVGPTAARMHPKNTKKSSSFFLY